MLITKGKQIGALKIVIYGPEGIGKSTFASKFPDPIFIDTEGSTKQLDVARMPRPSSWTMLMEQIKYIKNNSGICSTLILDTADWAEMLCIENICSTAKPPKAGIEDFGYGKGYVYLAEEFGRLLNLLEEIVTGGVYVVLTAHAKMRKVELPDELGAYDRWEMKLGKQTAPLVKEWADMVLFANFKTYVVNVDNQGVEKGKNKAQGGHRVMFTSHHPCWDAKNRHGLRDELPFEYSAIGHCIILPGNAPVAQQTTTQQTITPPAQEPPKQQEQPKQEPAKETKAPTAAPSPKLPKALTDLMESNGVAAIEIQQAVAKRGYYPLDTPIENYDASFISGVLVAAWANVFKMIQENRELNKMPFEGGN